MPLFCAASDKLMTLTCFVKRLLNFFCLEEFLLLVEAQGIYTTSIIDASVFYLFFHPVETGTGFLDLLYPLYSGLFPAAILTCSNLPTFKPPETPLINRA